MVLLYHEQAKFFYFHVSYYNMISAITNWVQTQHFITYDVIQNPPANTYHSGLWNMRTDTETSWISGIACNELTVPGHELLMKNCVLNVQIWSL